MADRQTLPTTKTGKHGEHGGVTLIYSLHAKVGCYMIKALTGNENFLRPTQWKYLKEVSHLSSSRRDANGTWLITPGVKNPKHVFVFLQQTRKQNSYTQNPYIFDTFNIDFDNSARLATCRLQYGTSFYPELDYDHDFKIRILNV